MPSRQCAVCACVNDIHNLGVALARLSEAALDVWGLVTFDFCHNPNPSTSLSVNELEDPGAIADSVRLEVKGWGLCGGGMKWVVPLFWVCGVTSLCALSRC